jgi:hypothetical protein
MTAFRVRVDPLVDLGMTADDDVVLARVCNRRDEASGAALDEIDARVNAQLARFGWCGVWEEPAGQIVMEVLDRLAAQTGDAQQRYARLRHLNVAETVEDRVRYFDTIEVSDGLGRVVESIRLHPTERATKAAVLARHGYGDVTWRT